MQDPLGELVDPDLFMGQHGLTEEPSVDPRDLTLGGGTGFLQDFEGFSPFQPGFDATVYAESSFTDLNNHISSSYPDLSRAVSGEDA